MDGVAVTSNDNTELALLNLSLVNLTCALSACKLRLQLSSPVNNIDAYDFHATFVGLDAESLESKIQSS
eukprot:scaffold87616_cov23-Cyclotella_meneghiniana.AAC.2